VSKTAAHTAVELLKLKANSTTVVTNFHLQMQKKQITVAGSRNPCVKEWLMQSRGEKRPENQGQN
jgi:hypothetical protein